MSLGFPGGSVVKNLPVNAGDSGSIPGLGRSPAEGNGNPLQYSCLWSPMDREAWWATVHGGLKRVKHSLATKQQQGDVFKDKKGENSREKMLITWVKCFLEVKWNACKRNGHWVWYFFWLPKNLFQEQCLGRGRGRSLMGEERMDVWVEGRKRENVWLWKGEEILCGSWK